MVLTLVRSPDAGRCSRPGCTEPAHARGLCQADYTLAWRQARIGMLSAEPLRRTGAGCAAPTCREPVHARGFCRRHEWQLQAHGRITDTVRWWAPPQPWTDQAACAEADPDLWFADPSDLDGITAAKKICATCPVRFQCLDHAVQTGEYEGIWGGLTTAERQAVA